MIELTIGNSYSRILGLSAVQEKELRKILSYSEDPSVAFFRGGYGPKKIPLIDKTNKFPTGLVNKVHDFFHNFKVEYSCKDTRIPPSYRISSSLTAAGSALMAMSYPYQTEAYLKAIDANQGCISMPTGSGKTLVILRLISMIGVKTLIIVPTLEIKYQMEEAVNKYLGTPHQVTVENIGSSRLKKLTNYDMLIIDEAHHSAAKTYRSLNKTAWNNIFYRYFFTATPFRSNTSENILFQSITGEVIYNLTYKEAAIVKAIVPVEAYYIEIPKQKTDAYTWAEVYKQLIVENKVRNELIANTILSLSINKQSSLCLVKEIKHGEILSQLTGAVFANGQDEYTNLYIKEFNNTNIRTLIGTTGVLGEGIDTKPCEWVIIAGLGKAKSQFMQQVGRAVRKYPGKESAKIIIIKDKSHRFCLRHYNEQCKILTEEYNAIPQKINL